jgi:hypothetical protein
MLSRLGASVRDVTLPSLQDWNACGWLILIAEAYSVYEPWLKTRYSDYGKNFRDRVTLGAFISSADYMAAIRFRRELREKLAQVMTRRFALEQSSGTPPGSWYGAAAETGVASARDRLSAAADPELAEDDRYVIADGFFAYL